MNRTMQDIEQLVRSHLEQYPGSQVSVSAHVINELRTVYGVCVLDEVYNMVEREIALETKAEKQVA